VQIESTQGDSPLHRMSPKRKFIMGAVLVIAFALVRDVRLMPLILLISMALVFVARLSWHDMWHRLRYPSAFVLVLMFFLPFFTGETVILQLGFLALRSEGLALMALVVGRFVAILLVTLVIFSTTPFLTTIFTLRDLGLPAVLVDMLMLTVRYLGMLGAMLARMQMAMRLRGFRWRAAWREGWREYGRKLSAIANVLASLLVRSVAKSERVYTAMRLRGYGEHQHQQERAEELSMANTHEPVALFAQNISIAYDAKTVVQNVTFTLGDGERVGIIGANGAGKSSLMLALCGAVPIAQGDIHIYGEPLQAGQFRTEIGLVFQHPDDQLFSLTVYDDVAFGARNAGMAESDVAQRVNDALQATVTAHLAERAPHHLSGGEKRMVAIACVLALHPRFVLYDEPDAHLDAMARRRLRDFLQEAPHGFLLASHDLEFIRETCERVIVMHNGRIVADGVPDTLMGDETFMQANGMDVPYSLR
jgi:cobalt/nickel transport system ATP-binding protein